MKAEKPVALVNWNGFLNYFPQFAWIPNGIKVITYEDLYVFSYDVIDTLGKRLLRALGGENTEPGLLAKLLLKVLYACLTSCARIIAGVRCRRYRRIIFLGERIEPSLNRFIRPKAVYYEWDIKEMPTEDRCRQMQKYMDVYTFDPGHASTYGIKHNPQYYLTPPADLFDRNPPIESDCFFAGYGRWRMPLLTAAAADMCAMGLRPKFLVAGEENLPPPLEWTPFLHYYDILRQSLASRSIFDPYRPGQTGYTLRVMEHMFFSKKLITTNPLVRQADFYNPANIFVYGEDDITTLKAWLDIPFKPVPEEIKDYYTLEMWVERFGSKR
ncbi:MAG: hypothetical protein LBR73_06250 [Oscillospiraceae bacterium]|jgi:hypothetical protein|nr:hypothetical protein [Oscillospiraceae bacterium]